MAHELVAALLDAPLWAQLGLLAFAAAAVYLILEPRQSRRAYGRRFEQLAGALGVGVTRGRHQWPLTCTVTIDGRAFELSYDYRGRTSGGGVSYRGPVGHLLICATPLRGSRWELHGIDVGPGAYSSRRAGAVASGDESFDGRFLVRQDGVPVREAWLDAPTRAAIAAFYDATGATGPTWVAGAQLQHIVPSPWTYAGASSIRALLQAEARLATAFERTAGFRAPAS